MKSTLTIIVLLTGASLLTGWCADKQPGQTDLDALAGQNLNAKAASDLETALARNPDDLAIRTKLLSYYFRAQFTSAQAKESHRRHVLWIIKNRPDAKIAGLPHCGIDLILDRDGYNEGKQLWLEQTRSHAQDSTILGHAAQYFLIWDNHLAEDLLKQAEKIEPNNSQWSERLGYLYALRDGKAAAAKSLAEYEKAQADDLSEISRYYRLDKLAKSAFKAGDMEKASGYANELLKAAARYRGDWNYGNAIHHGNNVLGLITLKQGDIKKADEYLLKAGQTPGSPQLGSFGPNMSLAKELLEKGEREKVLQYFESCRNFWQMGGEKLNRWKEVVEAGQIPSFGANLDY